MLKNIWGRLKKLDYRLVILLAVFAVIGTAGILFARADSPSSVAEAEDGQVVGNASKLNIGGRGAVRFNGPPITYDEIGISNYQTGATATQDQVSGEYIPGLAQSVSLANQHISNFGVNPKNVISALTIDPSSGTINVSLDFASSLDKRFGSAGILKDFSNKNQVLTACCHFDELGRILMTDKDGDGTADEDLNENQPRWVNDPGNSDTNTQGYGTQATYNRQIYYKAYAEIVRQVVDRYPNIKYVQVWNEMKGFFEPAFKPINGKTHAGGENYKKYTVFYNHVYNAVKTITRADNSKVEVGGPYVVMRSYHDSNPNSTGWNEPGLQSPGGAWGYVSQEHLEAVKYWNANKVGADFITLDIKNHNRCGNPNVPGDCEQEVNDDPYVRMDKYAAVVNWVRSDVSSSLPIWWAEWYARKNPIVQDQAPGSCWHVEANITITSSIDPTGKRIWHCVAGTTPNKAFQGTMSERNAIMTVGLIKTIKSRVRTALIWGTKSDLPDGKYHPLALYSDRLINTSDKTSFEATAINDTMKCIKQHFEKGAKLYNPRNTNDNIEVLATDGPSGKWLLMANKTANDNVTTNAFGRDFTFGKHQVQCVQP